MLKAIETEINKEIKLIEVVEVKNTARAPNSYICEIDGRSVIVAIGVSEIQKFYLKRSLENQKIFAQYFSVNNPIFYGELNNFFYVIYPYFEKFSWVKNELPIHKMEEIYSKYSKVYSLNNELINKIKSNFLSAWPTEFHTKIEELKLFRIYFSEIKKYKEIKLFIEHGDYTRNNILLIDSQIYLIDFEFCRDLQPIGFDIYDYCQMTGQKSNLDYEDLHKIKYDLINQINSIIDKEYLPKISQVNNNMKFIDKVDPNFIYNRFDKMYGKDFKLIEINEHGELFYIPVHFENKNASIGVWLSALSQNSFNALINYIFENYSNIENILVNHSINYYRGLKFFNHWKVKLTNDIEEFNNSLSKKTRYNTHWYPQKINKELGGYIITKISVENIEDSIVERYFKFKYDTHKMNYGLKPQEYLKKYYVDYAYILRIKDEIEAILFSCDVSKIVYVENLAYNKEYEKYSLGMVLYYHFINDLINQGKEYIFLGDGYLEYKRRYNGINQLTFTGNINRNFLNKKAYERLKKFADFGKGIKNKFFKKLYTRFIIVFKLKKNYKKIFKEMMK